MADTNRSDTTTASNFSLEASAHYIKWAYTFMERYYQHKGKKLGDRTAPKIAIDQLKALNVGISKVLDTPEAERDAAIAEFSYQKRGEIPTFLCAALTLARAVAADDKSISAVTETPDNHDPSLKALTKENFTKLANGLAASLRYFGGMHARSTKSQRTFQPKLYGNGTDLQRLNSRMNSSTIPLIYGDSNNVDGKKIPSAIGAYMLSVEYGFHAICDACGEAFKSYVDGFDGIKSLESKPAPDTSQHFQSLVAGSRNGSINKS